MTVDGHLLLKMLEPAIRPGGVSSTSGGGSVARQGNLPLEQQSFEQLLASQVQGGQIQGGQIQGTTQVASTEATDAQANAKADKAARTPGHGPLGQLARIDQIENSSLRNLMSSHVQSNAQIQAQQFQEAEQRVD